MESFATFVSHTPGAVSARFGFPGLPFWEVAETAQIIEDVLPMEIVPNNNPK
jgi:hypothetical protein